MRRDGRPSLSKSKRGFQMIRSAEEWFGLCARSESDRPNEWPPLLTVMRNRLEAPGWPKTAVGVVRQRLQFSYFNETSREVSEERAWALASAGYAGESKPPHTNDFSAAVAAARRILALPRA